MFYIKNLIFVALLVTQTACPQRSDNQRVATESRDVAPADQLMATTGNLLPYNLDAPSAVFDLDASLNEISGLSMSPNAAQLAAVQDERGQLFLIDKKTGKSTPSVTFQEEGDFEGIEFVGDTLWCLKSSGKLFKIWNWQKKPFDMAVFKIAELKTANLEGLGYDAKNHRLLLAAKGEKDDGLWSRTVYAFDLRKQTPSVIPAFSVSLTDFQTFLKGKTDKRYEKLITDYVTAPKTTGFDFGPSGIAVHPISGNIYVLSHFNKTLVVLSPSGKVLEMAKLDKTKFVQPEGLCFDADGTMYISSEIKDQPAARLSAFKMKK